MPRFLTAAAALLLTSMPAMAQNPQTTAPQNPTVPVAPPNAPAPPPERVAPGTITPPNVDPGITVKPPANGAPSTPVIPPPGTPGGNPAVIPK